MQQKTFRLQNLSLRVRIARKSWRAGANPDREEIETMGSCGGVDRKTNLGVAAFGAVVATTQAALPPPKKIPPAGPIPTKQFGNPLDAAATGAGRLHADGKRIPLLRS